MMIIRRLMAVLAALMLLCSLAAAQSPEDVMATVNGTPITRQAFEGYLNNLTAYYAYYGYDVTTPENAAALRYMALDTLVQLTLMDQKIAEMGLVLTEDELAAAEAEGRALWVEDVGNALARHGVTAYSTEAERAAAMVQVLAELETRGYTEESYIADAISNALYIKLEALMVAEAAVREGEVEALYADLVEADRARYADNAAEYESTLQLNAFALLYGMTEYYTDVWYIPEGYRNVVHILLPVDGALLDSWGDLQATWEEQQNVLEEGGTILGEIVTAAEVENAGFAALATVQAQVDEITGRIAAGESFTDLIPLYTADAEMDEPAEIAAGWQVHMDSVFCPIGYREAAFSLVNPGDVSAPFVSDEGVYLVCYVGDAEGGPVPLTQEVHEALHAQLLQEAEAAQYQQTMDAWLAAAEIVYSDEAMAFMGS